MHFFLTRITFLGDIASGILGMETTCGENVLAQQIGCDFWKQLLLLCCSLRESQKNISPLDNFCVQRISVSQHFLCFSVGSRYFPRINVRLAVQKMYLVDRKCKLLLLQNYIFDTALETAIKLILLNTLICFRSLAVVIPGVD